MSDIESEITKHSYGLSSFRTSVKNNKPSHVTNSDIDNYIDYYFTNL